MKTDLKSAMLLLFIFFTFNLNAQTERNSSELSVIETTKLIHTKTEIRNIEFSNWFTGSTQKNIQPIFESENNNKKSALISKKEQYLQLGLSNKTLLIRSILKKADSYANATV